MPAEKRVTMERGLPGYDAQRLDDLGLSRRELAVLERVAEGRTNEEIARALGLSALTVKKHLERMSLKLGASNRAALVALAWRRASSGSPSGAGLPARRKPQWGRSSGP